MENKILLSFEFGCHTTDIFVEHDEFWQLINAEAKKEFGIENCEKFALITGVEDEIIEYYDPVIKLHFRERAFEEYLKEKKEY